jgi:hypothetical protein
MSTEASAAPTSDSATTENVSSQQSSGTPQGSDEASAIDAAAQAGDITPAQAKEYKKKLKLKVDGKEIEEEIDFNDDEALTRHLQKSKAFDTRNKEFTGFRSQVDQFFAEFQADPEAVMERLGMDVDAIATKRLQKKVEEMSKSPEQVAAEKRDKELEQLRKERDELKKQHETAEMESLRNKQAADIENSITTALERSKARLPQNNPKVYQMIAQNMLMAMENGYNDVTVDDIIPIVERQWKEELRGYFDSSSEDLIEELLGKQNLDRLRKKRLATRSKQAPPPPVSKQILDTGTSKPKDEAPKQKQSYKQFFKD